MNPTSFISGSIKVFLLALGGLVGAWFIVFLFHGQEAEVAAPSFLFQQADQQGEPLPPGAIARLGVPRSRQPGGVYRATIQALAFSPDGSILASTQGHWGVVLWDTATGQEIRRLDVKGVYLYYLFFSPDGKRLGWSGNDNISLTGVIDLATGKKLWRAPGGGQSVFTPDGKAILVGACHQYARLLNAETGQEIYRFEGPDKNWQLIANVALSPDGKTAATDYQYYNLLGRNQYNRPIRTILWEISSGEMLASFENATHQTRRMIFSPDGQSLIQTSPWQGSIYFRNLRTGEVIRQVGMTGNIVFLLPAPRGQIAVLKQHYDSKSDLNKSTIHFLEADTGREVRQIETGKRLWFLAFSPDGKTLAGCGEEAFLCWWDMTTGTILKEFEGHRGTIQVLRNSADGKTLASWDSQKEICLWDVAARRQRFKYYLNSYFPEVDFSPDGGVLALNGSNQRILLLKLPEVKIRGFLPGPPALVRFAPDGQAIAWVEWHGDIHLIDLASGKERKKFLGHKGEVRALAFSGDGAVLASASWTKSRSVIPPEDPWPPVPDDSVRLWEVATGKEKWRGQAKAECLALSADGNLIAFGVQNQITIRNQNVNQVHTWQGDSGAVTALAFSLDGKYLISGGQDGIIVWSAATGKERFRFPPVGAVHQLLILPDGRTLASAGEDGSILLWDWVGFLPKKRS